jgi:hypothetical protein
MVNPIDRKRIEYVNKEFDIIFINYYMEPELRYKLKGIKKILESTLNNKNNRERFIIK